MNIALWVLQVVAAFQGLAGGAFKVFSFDKVAEEPWFGALPRAVWTAAGLLEIVLAVLLIVPAATGWMPMLTPLAAAVLALESLVLGAVYARSSLKLTAANPLVWVLAMAFMTALIAFGRFQIAPVS